MRKQRPVMVALSVGAVLLVGCGKSDYYDNLQNAWDTQTQPEKKLLCLALKTDRSYVTSTAPEGEEETALQFFDDHCPV
jgi:hypothetical protein